ISDSAFLGGKFDFFRIEDAGGLATSSALESSLPTIPEIKPNESYEWSHGIRIPVDGLVWVEAKIRTSDGQEVRHFQIREYDMGTEWKSPLHVISKENSRIISLLSEIAKSLKSSKA
ncbi:MAG: hypothetical protein WCD81_05450, partial [Candidatus Bathyarchaeia archaeon]